MTAGQSRPFSVGLDGSDVIHNFEVGTDLLRLDDVGGANLGAANASVGVAGDGERTALTFGSGAAVELDGVSGGYGSFAQLAGDGVVEIV